MCEQRSPQVVDCTTSSSFHGRLFSLPCLRCHRLWLAVTANMDIYLFFFSLVDCCQMQNKVLLFVIFNIEMFL